MSKYTDSMHEYALEKTRYWQDKIIDSPEKMYQYGRYFEKIKDFQAAAQWFDAAYQANWQPAAFSLLHLAKNQLIDPLDQVVETAMESACLSCYQDPQDSEEHYRRGIIELNGWSTAPNCSSALKHFQLAAASNHGGALYELALLHLVGTAGLEASYNAARQYLRQAYDCLYELAIFKDFEIFSGTFEDYDYQREIKEAYSFKLGQHIRVAEAKQDRRSYEWVIEMYQNGFPGDTGPKLEEFIAKKYRFIKELAKLEPTT